MATRTVIQIREFASYREPMLEEILSDPIVRAVMRADGVDTTKLRTMLARIAETRTPSAGPSPTFGASARPELCSIGQ
jgi:hypothetical protein